MAAVNVTGTGKALEKFVEVCGQGVGAIWAHFMIVPAARARAQAMLIEGEARDMRELREAAVREQIAAPAFAGVSTISPLGDKVFEQGLQFQQQKRLRNLAMIADTASSELAKCDPGDVSDEPVDADWVARYFAAAQDVSSDEMQILWAKVLAREVTDPGSVSHRTLQVLSAMGRREADYLQLALDFAVYSPGAIAPTYCPTSFIRAHNHAFRVLNDYQLIGDGAFLRNFNEPLEVVVGGNAIVLEPSAFSRERGRLASPYIAVRSFTLSAQEIAVSCGLRARVSSEAVDRFLSDALNEYLSAWTRVQRS